MGFGTSGAVAVVFVGLLIAVGIAYPTLETANDRRSTAIDDRDRRALDVKNTDIDLTDAAYNATGADELTVNVTNTGSTTLSVDETDLLVDGVYQESYETTVDNESARSLWQPGERLTMTVSLASAPNRVKVVTENGVAETETEVA